MTDADALAAYEKFDFTDGPWTRPVYRRGSGPAVIVIHEMPGLHPLVARFADRARGGAVRADGSMGAEAVLREAARADGAMVGPHSAERTTRGRRERSGPDEWKK